MITERDIDSIKACGEFNSIRLPMHYNLFTLPVEGEPVKGQDTWKEEGFRMTDDLLFVVPQERDMADPRPSCGTGGREMTNRLPMFKH